MATACISPQAAKRIVACQKMSVEEQTEPSSVNKTESELLLTTAYNFSLNHRIQPTCALSAIIEPKTNETLVAVTNSNKIIIKSSESPLSIPDKIKCISTVPFGNGYDYIVIGTESQIIVFDFYQNSTVFQREVPDGINCFAVGSLADRDMMILCGGNCAIWGFDETGQDKYWTVTGDSVTTMCLCDYDGDGELELIIGSPDHEIRVFKDDLMRHELMETDAIVALTGVSYKCFVYALANGTLGMYDKDTRIWRIKSKQTVSSLLNYPTNEDLFTCVWNTGKVDIRYINTGDSITSKVPDTNLQIAAAFKSQTLGPMSTELTLVTIDGKVSGYGIEQKAGKADKSQEVLRDYGQKKHNLLMELSNFEAEEHLSEAEKERQQRIPAGTVVESSFYTNYEERTLFIRLHASNKVCIRGVIAFAEGMFEGDSFIWIPENFEGDGDEIKLPILPEKDMENELSLRVFLGDESADKLFVFEVKQVVPRFSRFAILSPDDAWEEPKSYVQFTTKQRTQRVHDWVLSAFVVTTDSFTDVSENDLTLTVRFMELAPKRQLYMSVEYDSVEGKMLIRVDCMETAASLVQSLTSFLSIDQLESDAHFETQFKEVEEIVGEMDGMWEVRDRLTTELSEKQSMVKEVVIRGEDAIVLDDMDMARKYYTKLRHMERSLRQAFLLRSTNNERFVGSLRRLNKIIENASKLRVGEPSRAIVAACREAITEDNKEIIVKVLQFGAKT